MAWEKWQEEIAKSGEDKTITELTNLIGKKRAAVKRYMDRNKLPYVSMKSTEVAYSDEQILQIEAALATSNKSHREIAEELKVSRSIVSYVSSGRRTTRGVPKPEVRHKSQSTTAQEAFKKVFG